MKISEITNSDDRITFAVFLWVEIGREGDLSKKGNCGRAYTEAIRYLEKYHPSEYKRVVFILTSSDRGQKHALHDEWQRRQQPKQEQPKADQETLF